jgi:ABC-type phosphate transport system substrate-binding protein
MKGAMDMTKKVIVLPMLLLTLILLIGCYKEEVKTITEASAPKKIDKFVVAGSGTCLPITRELAKEF